MAKRLTAPVVFYLFDVLWHDGRDITSKSVLQRRDRLEQIIAPVAGIQVGGYMENHALNESKTLLAIAGAAVEMSIDVSPTPDRKRGIIEFPIFLAPTFKYQRKEDGHSFAATVRDRSTKNFCPNYGIG